VSCHKCSHSRPPRVQTFTELSLPVEAPLATPPISFFRSPNSLHSPTPPLATADVQKLQRLSDCLGRFAAGEILTDVECLNCSCQAQVLSSFLHSLGRYLMSSIQMESFQIMTSSSWATDSQNIKSLLEIKEKVKLLEQNKSSEKRLEELIPEKERERTTATKQLMVSKFPEILCFQFSRNIFDMKTQRMIKLRHHIKFPIEIHENDTGLGLNFCVNLSPKPHLNQQSKKDSSQRLGTSSSSSSLSSSTASVPGNDSTDPSGRMYHLRAVIVHHGGPESGHHLITSSLTDA
jgi:hypothetical protein